MPWKAGASIGEHLVVVGHAGAGRHWRTSGCNGRGIYAKYGGRRLRIIVTCGKSMAPHCTTMRMFVTNALVSESAAAAATATTARDRVDLPLQ